MSLARGKQAGFTLVEVVVVVAIIAIAAGVIMPAVGNLSRAELRKSARMLSSYVRSAFDSAALSGQTHRLVFEFGSRTIKLQASDALLAFDPDSNMLVEAAKAAHEYAQSMSPEALGFAAETDEDKDREGDAGPEFNPVTALLSMGRLSGPQGQASAGFQDVGTFELSDGVKLLDVWTGGMSQPEREGEIYLVFFPHGYTQDAIIHLEDEEGRVFAIKVWALTGKAEVLDHYVEAKP